MSRNACTSGPSTSSRGTVATSVALTAVLLASTGVAIAGKGLDPYPSVDQAAAGGQPGPGEPGEDGLPHALAIEGDTVAPLRPDQPAPRATSAGVARSAGAVADDARGEVPRPTDTGGRADDLVPAPHDPDAAQVPVPEGTLTQAPAADAHEPTEEPEPVDPPPATSIDGATWDRLAACESGHGGPAQWDHNRFHHLDPYSDARFYGGLHFNKMSWDWAVEVGGHDVPYWPHEASRAQQIAVAETLRRIHPAGWGAWPECSRHVGLR
jgi:hypothetical protein